MIVPGDLYPRELRVSPRLAMWPIPIRMGCWTSGRDRNFFDLLKENAALQARLREREGEVGLDTSERKRFESPRSEGSHDVR